MKLFGLFNLYLKTEKNLSVHFSFLKRKYFEIPMEFRFYFCKN